jgi:hypothetical protein
MEMSDKTARQIWAEVKANPNRARFGYGKKAVLVNIDFQRAYTRPGRVQDRLRDRSAADRAHQRAGAALSPLGWPVVWTYVAYAESGEDAGVWGTRTNTPDSLQNIKHGSRRAELDERCDVQHGATSCTASACHRLSSKRRCSRCWSGTRSTRW